MQVLYFGTICPALMDREKVSALVSGFSGPTTTRSLHAVFDVSLSIGLKGREEMQGTFWSLDPGSGGRRSKRLPCSHTSSGTMGSPVYVTAALLSFHAFKTTSGLVTGTTSKEDEDGQNVKVGNGSRATKDSIPAEECQSGRRQEEGSSS
ncbi:hypothetical protein DPEC_G00200440 [Dallia pectoralis]|uniref:Uncharacterized protein n=1 Tax=Dallia pectoralis TaxID=75939 RepID=A0ACC2G8S8_DALPE|nr:hypothetical protein DPEC_G00200440 [Dallia pectoralis]